MSRIFQAQVQSVSGNTINTTAGALQRIGNLQINVGDYVQTDGRYVYGHQPYLSGGVFAAAKEDTGIPIVYGWGDETTKKKAYYSIKKRKIIRGKGTVDTSQTIDANMFYFANKKNKWGYHGNTRKDYIIGKSFLTPYKCDVDFDIIEDKPFFFNGVQVQIGDDVADFSSEIYDVFFDRLTIPGNVQLLGTSGYYAIDCSANVTKENNLQIITGTAWQSTVGFRYYLERFFGELKIDLKEFTFNFEEYYRRIEVRGTGEEIPQKINSIRQLQDGFEWIAQIDFGDEPFGNYWEYNQKIHGIGLDGASGTRAGDLKDQNGVTITNINWSNNGVLEGIRLRDFKEYAPKGICKIGENEYLYINGHELGIIKDGQAKILEDKDEIESLYFVHNSRLRIMDNKTLKKWLNTDDVITGNNIFE